MTRPMRAAARPRPRNRSSVQTALTSVRPDAQPFPGHRDQLAVDANPDVVAEFDRAVAERTRLGAADELDHVGDVGGQVDDRCSGCV